jgi:hypothetical protein
VVVRNVYWTSVSRTYLQRLTRSFRQRKMTWLFLKWHILLLEILSIFAIVTLESAALGYSDCSNGGASASYCSNDSVSCSCQVNI